MSCRVFCVLLSLLHYTQICTIITRFFFSTPLFKWYEIERPRVALPPDAFSLLARTRWAGFFLGPLFLPRRRGVRRECKLALLCALTASHSLLRFSLFAFSALCSCSSACTGVASHRASISAGAWLALGYFGHPPPGFFCTRVLHSRIYLSAVSSPALSRSACSKLFSRGPPPWTLVFLAIWVHLECSSRCCSGTAQPLVFPLGTSSDGYLGTILTERLILLSLCVRSSQAANTLLSEVLRPGPSELCDLGSSGVPVTLPLRHGSVSRVPPWDSLLWDTSVRSIQSD